MQPNSSAFINWYIEGSNDASQLGTSSDLSGTWEEVVEVDESKLLAVAPSTTTGGFNSFGARKIVIPEFKSLPGGGTIAIEGDITVSGKVDGVDVSQLATTVDTNSDKVGITTAQADEITANTAKTGITSGEQTKLGHITVTKAANLDTMGSNISTNNDKVGITSGQAGEITANTAKTGITSGEQTKLGHITVTKAAN